MHSVLRDLEEDHIRSVCFSRGGSRLATGSGVELSSLTKHCLCLSTFLQIWKINTRYVQNAFKGHILQVMSLDFSPGDHRLVSASDDNTVRLWNIRYGAVAFLTEDNPTYLDYRCYSSALFSLDGNYVVAPNHDGMVRAWAVRTGLLMRRVQAHVEWVYGYCLYAGW